MRAIEADNNYNQGKDRLLEGLCVGVKDNIDVKFHYTTVGQRSNVLALHNSDVWRKFKNQGAICGGKTNMDELAMGHSTMNKTWGTAKSSLDITRTAGGSSGGSAGTVGLNVLPVALGTDYGGAVRIPAACNGVIGYRPTVNRWPSDYAFKVCDNKDVVGPMATCMDDIAG